MKPKTPAISWTFCVVDFKDAFYTLHTLREEWPFWVVFLCVAFGLKSGLFLWGRAALAARFAQSLVALLELRMQEYVDDPMIIAAGSREQRLRLLTVVLLFWAALSFDLCWKKSQKGPTVEWMGGELCLLQQEVAVQLTGARTQAAKDNINELLHGQDMLLVKKLVFFHWIHVVDCVSGASGQTMCLDALGGTHRSYPVDTEEKHDEKAAREVGFCQTHFSLSQMGSCSVVSTGSTSANFHFECPTRCPGILLRTVALGE